MTDPTEAAAAEIDPKATHVSRQWKHSAAMLGCRFDPTGRYVFGSSMDMTIQRWDLQKDTQSSFAGHDSWLRGIGFSADGTRMYSAGYDGRLCFWDATAESGDQSVAPLREVDAHEGWIRWLEVSPDGKVIATAGNDHAVRMWSAESGDLIRSLDKHEAHVYSLMFHPTGEWMLSGDLKGQIHQWETTTGAHVRTIDAKPLHTYHGGQQVDYGGVRCMSLSHDGKELACGGLHKATNPFAGVQEPLVVVFNWETGEEVRTHEANAIPRGIVWRLAHESDGLLVGGIGGQQGYVVFWKEDKLDVHQLKLPSPALDMDRHPQRPEVVAACFDGSLRVIRMAAKVA